MNFTGEDFDRLSRDEAIKQLKRIYQYAKIRKQVPLGAERTVYDTRFYDGGNEAREHIQEMIEDKLW